MFSRTKLITASLAIALCAVAGYAQEQPTQTPNQKPEAGNRERPFARGEGRGFRRGPGPGGMLGPELMRQLNLSEDQQKQVRTIMTQSFESTRTQHEELRQLAEKRFQGTLTSDEETRARTLRQQLATSMKDTQSRIAALLTADQKTKLEEIMKERRENRGGFGERRRGFRQNRGTEPTPKPGTPPNN